MRKARPIFALAILVLLLAVAYSAFDRVKTRKGSKSEQTIEFLDREFRSIMQELKSAAKNKEILTEIEDRPKLRGKLLVVDFKGMLRRESPSSSKNITAITIGGPRVDPVQLLLPSGLAATKVGEVGTLAVIEYQSVQMGTYTDGAPAFRIDCTVSVIDWEGRKRIASTTMQGPPPPKTRPALKDGSSMHVVGTPPDKDILVYLESVFKP